MLWILILVTAVVLCCVAGGSKGIFGHTFAVFFVVGLLMLIVIGCHYGLAYHNPAMCKSLEVSIAEAKQLLIDNPGVGEGLEGLEIKKSIAHMIERKNRFRATVNVMRANRVIYVFAPKEVDWQD